MKVKLDWSSSSSGRQITNSIWSFASLVGLTHQTFREGLHPGTESNWEYVCGIETFFSSLNLVMWLAIYFPYYITSPHVLNMRGTPYIQFSHLTLLMNNMCLATFSGFTVSTHGVSGRSRWLDVYDESTTVNAMGIDCCSLASMSRPFLCIS